MLIIYIYLIAHFQQIVQCIPIENRSMFLKKNNTPHAQAMSWWGFHTVFFRVFNFTINCAQKCQ